MSSPYLFDVTTILFNGDWGELTRPLITEVTSYNHRYRGEYNNFYNMRRGIRVSIAADLVQDVERDFFLQSGTDVLSLEIIVTKYTDMTSIIKQIRKIFRAYKRQNEYAEITITEFTIVPKKGKYFATAGISARVAANA